jgi:hypothetical protein
LLSLDDRKSRRIRVKTSYRKKEREKSQQEFKMSSSNRGVQQKQNTFYLSTWGTDLAIKREKNWKRRKRVKRRHRRLGKKQEQDENNYGMP